MKSQAKKNVLSVSKSIAIGFLSLLSLAFPFCAALGHIEQPNYCVGIRGNGELIAAHWPAMARMVEELGMPQAIAGGSSGSITTFLVESVALNPDLALIADPIERRQRQSLLIKSMPFYLQALARHSQAVSGFEFLNSLMSQGSEVTEILMKSLAATNGARNPGQKLTQELYEALKKYGPLLNPEILRGLASHPAHFRKAALEALEFFGKFNATTDRDIFFRPGLIDFKYFALLIGQIGDFYAGNTPNEHQTKLMSFLNNCSKQGYGRHFADLSANCQNEFTQLVDQYLSTPWSQYRNQRIFESLGLGFSSFATTSIIKGEAKEKFTQMMSAYNTANQNIDYSSYSINFDTDIAYGYWGQQSSLEKIQTGLEPFIQKGDLKSKKFLPLESANWFEVLSISPAEPGLTNIQNLIRNSSRESVLTEATKDYTQRWTNLQSHEKYVSAGGWSDLHPTLILKAYGCENIIYLTRQNGESIFGQTVFIRLTGTQNQIPFWKDLSLNNDRGWDVKGTEADNTPWNQLYNLGNKESSFNRSLGETDAVYCTDWNSFEVFHGELNSMLRDSYGAPVLLRPGSLSKLQVNKIQEGIQAQRFQGCNPL
ncbi:MAG: hypothetical protein IPL83_00465 [Bdellovibrionales bacterium]|nr:hypothetical protein [Bdellovibrionales bacterium]